MFFASLAQLVELRFCKPSVGGSSPLAGSVIINKKKYMSQDNLIALACSECKTVNYHSHKNKKTLKNRLEMNKFCKKCKKHISHKETK